MLKAEPQGRMGRALPSGSGSVFGFVGKFKRITPAIMSPMPAICQKTRVSRKMMTPMTAVSAVPTPDHVA